MKVSVRRMTVEDIPDVKRVDLLSFQELVEARHPDVRRITPRTDDNLLSYMRSDPEGAFVALGDHAGIIGSSFSHIWGKTGWVGPVSVLPAYQGKGVGKELVKRSLEYLDQAGCSDIGLETMPENQVNIGMYMRIGLKPAGLVLMMGKGLTEGGIDDVPDDDAMIERLSESRAKESLLGQMRKLSDSVQPGLDYTREAVLTQDHASGETLLALDGNRLLGFSIVHTHPRRERMQNAVVKALVVSPGAGTDPLIPLIAASELLALDDRSAELSVPVPAMCTRAVDALLSRGYSVAQTYERMMWLGTSGMSERVYNLCSWSG
ncbi:MAG: GNAT family N-acetyltransferase [Candidatus Thermoplasmatota archaeon]